MTRKIRRAWSNSAMLRAAGRACALEALEVRQMLSGPPSSDPAGDLWDGSLPGSAATVASLNAGALRFEGAFIMNKSAGRIENVGAFRIGLRPAGVEAFRPLITVSGSLTYDATRVFSITGANVDALIAGAAPTRLFSGSFSIGFADAWTRSLTETDPASGLSLGPAAFSMSWMSFANPDAGSTADSRVQARGTLALPAPVGGGQAVVQGGDYVGIAPEGLTFTGAPVPGAAGATVAFSSITLRAAGNVWADFAPFNAAGAGELRVSGDYTLPDFGDATVALTRPGTPNPVYLTSSGAPGAGTLGMNAPFRADGLDITWDGSWRLDNVKFEPLHATTIVTTDAQLYMGGQTGNHVTARVIANKRVEIEFTYQNGADLQVHGAGIDLTQPGGFFFTSDKTPTANGRADNWDPEIRLHGNLGLQPNADGTAAGQLVFAIPANAPLKANFNGASMAAITQAGPQAGVQLLGIRQATLTDTKIELKLDDDYFQLDTTARYAEFNDQTIEFRGEDDFGLDLFIKVRDFFDVSVDGFLTLDPIVITEDWRFDEFFFWVEPFALGSQNGFKGTALLETPLRQGPNAYQTEFLVTLAAFDFTVDPNSPPGPAFVAAGMPVTLASMAFTPDRSSPPNQFTIWDPQLALVGAMPVPVEWGGFILPFGGPQAPILVNEDGIDVSAGWAMPAGQTFKIINVVDVTTVAGLRLHADLDADKAWLDGTFTLPSLGGAVLDSRSVNGHSFDMAWDDNAMTRDFAANAATAPGTEAPIWTVFKLINISVGVSKQYGQPGTMGGTATLQTNLNPVPLTLNFVNGVLQPTNGPLNAVSNAFTFVGTLLGPVDFTFVPDRDPGAGPVWDPTFTFGGALKLPNGFGDGTFLVPLDNLLERISLTIDGLDLAAQVKIPNQNFKFTVGGQELKLKSTNVILSVAKPPGQPIFLKFQGKLEITQSVWFLPQTIEADLEAPNNYFSINTAGVINAVGKISAKKMSLKGFELKEFTLGFNTTTNTWSGDAKLKVPKVPATIIAGIEFIDGYVNRVTLGVDDLGILMYGSPATQTGIFFEGVTGQVNNLAPGSPSPWVELGGTIHLKAGQALPPPAHFTITLPEFLGGETKIDGKIVDARISGFASLVQVKGSAEVKVIGNLIKGNLNAELNWSNSPVYFKLDGSLSVLAGLYTYTGAVRIDSHGNFSARGGVSLQIPTGFHTLFSGRLARWLATRIEGTAIASAQGGVKFTNDGTYGNDVVYAYGTAFGRVVGVKVHFDGTIGTILSQSALAGLRVPGEFIVPADTDEATFFVAWDNDSSTPPFELRDPEGNLVTDYTVDADLAGPTNFGIRVNNPMAGTWRVTVTDTTGLGAVEYEAYAPNQAPTIAITSPVTDVTSPGTVTIGYEAYDDDNDAEINIYYSDQFGEFSGIPIGSAIEADGSGSFLWNTAGLPAGEYTIYAEIDDGFHELSGAFAVGRVTVVDPDAPAQVTGTEVLWLGGTKASLSWDAVAGAEYYVVSYTSDAAGPAFTDYFTVVDGDTSLELSGLAAGETYRFSVRAGTEATTEGAESKLGIRGVPMTGVIGHAPSVAPGAGEWDVFADPGAVYGATLAIPAGGSAVMLVAPAGATLDGSGNFSWSVPGAQDGWTDVVFKVTDGDGQISLVRYVLLSDDERTIDLGGQTWDDTDGDGSRALTENGLSGVTVRLVDAETGAVLLTLVSADDDRNSDTAIDPYSEQGLYRFTGLTPGRYIVRVEPAVDQDVTDPVSGEHERTLAKGLEDDDLDFGLFTPPPGITQGSTLAGAGITGTSDRTSVAGAIEPEPLWMLAELPEFRALSREPWNPAARASAALAAAPPVVSTAWLGEEPAWWTV